MSKKILIIDDCIEIQELLKVFFCSKGHNVVSAPNGEQAGYYLSHCDDLPDVILLDVQMPEMNGFEFLDWKHEDFRLKDIPVLLISGRDNLEPIKDRSDIFRVLKKPIDINSLNSSIAKL